MGPSGCWIDHLCTTGLLLMCVFAAPASGELAHGVEERPKIIAHPRSTNTIAKGACPTLPDLPNALIVSGWSEDVYPLGHVVTYACRSGTSDVVARNFSIVCQVDDKSLGKPRWSSPYFLCQITCIHPENPVNGFTDGKYFTFGSTVIFKCRRGYILSGAQNSTCLDNGEWDASVPECREMECEQPPVVKNGEAVLDVNKKYLVRYKCQPGFTLDENLTLECLDDGTWSPRTLPFCRPQLECPRPPYVPHASLPLSGRPSYELGSWLRYRCNPGYTVSRDSSYTIACVNSSGLAMWTHPKLSCLPKQCSFPGEVENGYFNGTDFMYRGKITYHCNTGYFTEEKENGAECMADGMWSRNTPSCEPVQCPEPLDIPGGIITTPSSLTFDSVIRYRCKGEMQLMGPSLRVCQADGTWGGLQPKCMAVLCSPFKDVANGQWQGGELTNNVVTFSCDDGFLLAGEQQITCLPNRQWSGYPPTCQPVCPPPPADVYAHVPDIVAEKRFFTVGEKVLYRCGGGYSSWDYTLLCTKEHKWQQMERHFLYPRGWKCPAFCYRPPPQERSALSKSYEYIDFYAISKFVYFDCMHGYTTQARGFYMQCVVGSNGFSSWKFYSGWRCTTGRSS